jgi:DNA-binding transcriptional MerR regulator
MIEGGEDLTTWIELISEAKKLGLSTQEVRQYLKKAAHGNVLPTEK